MCHKQHLQHMPGLHAQVDLTVSATAHSPGRACWATADNQQLVSLPTTGVPINGSSCGWPSFSFLALESPFGPAPAPRLREVPPCERLQHKTLTVTMTCLCAYHPQEHLQAQVVKLPLLQAHAGSSADCRGGVPACLTQRLCAAEQWLTLDACADMEKEVYMNPERHCHRQLQDSDSASNS